MTDTNPYQSPDASPPGVNGNTWGQVGLLLSGGSFCGLAMVGHFSTTINFIASLVVLLSLPGMLVSLVGLFYTPRRLAAWGFALGLFCAMFISTLFWGLLR